MLLWRALHTKYGLNIFKPIGRNARFYTVALALDFSSLVSYHGYSDSVSGSWRGAQQNKPCMEEILSQENVSACIDQVISADIHALFLNPTFGLGLILALPMCMVFTVLIAQPPKNLSVEEFIRFLCNLHNYTDSFLVSFTKPITWFPFAFHCVLLGWFHQLVEPKIGIMVQGTSLTPPFTFRIMPECADSANQIIKAHDPAVNHIWVSFEHTKCIALQYIDWLIIYYILICCLCVTWCFWLGWFCYILGRGYTGVTPHLQNESAKTLVCGPIFLSMFNNKYQNIEKYLKKMGSWKSVSVLFMLEVFFLSPYCWLLWWLPIASTEYYGFIDTIQSVIRFRELYEYGDNKLGDSLEVILANPSFSKHPILFLAHTHMECVHAVWKAFGLM